MQQKPLAKPLGIIGYYRVSTTMQGHEGLGMEAQRCAVEAYSTEHNLPIIASYQEVETGRKADLRNRPQLSAALTHAFRSRARLVIARMDRLARNVLVTSQLLESNVDFVACDVPYASRLTIQILAVIAEHESTLISERIKAANAVARARGVDFRRPQNRLLPAAQKLGTLASNREAIERSARVYKDLIPLVKELRASGLGLKKTAEALNEMGHSNQRGNPWHRGTIYTLLVREKLSTQAPEWYLKKNPTKRDHVQMTIDRHKATLAEIERLSNAGLTHRAIAKSLNKSGSRTPRGCRWTMGSVNNLRQRRGAIDRTRT